MTGISRVFVLILLLLFVFSGCKHKNKAPAGLIEREKMIQVMVDIHLADGLLMQPAIQSKPYHINKEKFYQQVLKKHQVSLTEFSNSLDFYSRDPKKFQEMYDKVIEILSIMQANQLNQTPHGKK